MCPAPRKPENRRLPPNLHRHPKGFRYRRPDRSYVYLGHDEAEAINAAKGANLHFSSKGDLFDKIVKGDEQSLSSVIDDYLTNKLPKFEIGEDTRKNREYALRKIQSGALGNMPVDEVSTRDLYLYLESLGSDWTRQGYRAVLMQLFAWTIQTGLRDDNPVIAVERPKAKRQRQRMSIEMFHSVRAHCPAWLQNVMDLQLHTLQRPGDVVAMRWTDVADNVLRVVQKKTGRKLELEISEPLRSVLARCRDDLLSPFIAHRRPEKLRSKDQRAKTRSHHTQILLEQAERAFDIAREKCELLRGEPNPPTLHEIRSLGAALYREAGWPEDQVQLLLGHTDLKMTRHYLKGHEAPWERIAAGLNLAVMRY